MVAEALPSLEELLEQRHAKDVYVAECKTSSSWDGMNGRVSERHGDAPRVAGCSLQSREGSTTQALRSHPASRRLPARSAR